MKGPHQKFGSGPFTFKLGVHIQSKGHAMNLPQIRIWQITKMTLSIKAYESFLVHVSDDDMLAFTDGPDGWTGTQVLGHLRDFEDVFHERCEVASHAEAPPLPFPDPDELAAERDYNSIGWRALLAEWKTARLTHQAYLNDLMEDDWERKGMHPHRGEFSIHDQLFLTTLHDAIHMEQLTRILAQKYE